MAVSNHHVSLDWENTALPEAPTAPETLQEAGLTLTFLSDLLMRVMYTRGAMLGLDLARFVCLPFKVIEEALRFLVQACAVEQRLRGGLASG